MAEAVALPERKRPWGAVLAATTMVLVVCGVLLQSPLAKNSDSGLYGYESDARPIKEPLAVAIGQDGSLRATESNGELQRLLALVEEERSVHGHSGKRTLHQGKGGSSSSSGSTDVDDDDDTTADDDDETAVDDDDVDDDDDDVDDDDSNNDDDSDVSDLAVKLVS
jgi:hypothetical protein